MGKVTTLVEGHHEGFHEGDCVCLAPDRGAEDVGIDQLLAFLDEAVDKSNA